MDESPTSGFDPIKDGDETLVFWQSTVQNQQQCCIHQKKCDWTIKIGDPTFKMMIETSIVGLKKWTRETTMTKQWHLNINEWTWIGETYKDLSHQKKGWDLVKNSKMDQHFQFGKYDNLSMHSVKWLHIECEQMEVELVYRHSQGLCLQSI